MKNTTLFLDSGIGGLSLLCEAEKFFKGNFLYVADFFNSPYGNKTKEQIKQVVLNNVSYFIKKFNPKCIVLACNTATAVCVEDVRKLYPNIFVVGCEPAIKPAINNGCKNVLVLCTVATKKYSKYLSNFKDVNFFCPKKLSKLIDENFCENKEDIQAYLKRTLKKFYKKYDGVVLGCTHYVLFKNYIQNILGCKVFDGNKGVIKQIFKFIKNHKSTKHLTLVSTDIKKQYYLKSCYKKIKEQNLCAE